MKSELKIKTHEQCIQIIESIENIKYHKEDLERRKLKESSKGVEGFLLCSEKWHDDNIEKNRKSIEDLKTQYNKLIKKIHEIK